MFKRLSIYLLGSLSASLILAIGLGVFAAPHAKADSCDNTAGGTSAYGFNATIAVNIIDSNGNPYSASGQTFTFHVDMTNQQGQPINSGVYPGIQHVNSAGVLDAFGYSHDFTSTPGGSNNDVVCTMPGGANPVNAWKFFLTGGKSSWYLNCGSGPGNIGYGFRFYGVDGTQVNGLSGHYVGRGSQGDPFSDVPFGISVNNQAGSHMLTFQLDNPKPTGLVSAQCPADPNLRIVGGWAGDASDPTKPINVDVYFDTPADGNTSAPHYLRLVTNPSSSPPGAFSGAIPAAYQDGREHTAYFYGLDYPTGAGDPSSQLFGSPAKFTCGIPAPQYGPWLQTLKGDVTSNGSITGQGFSLPGSRINYDYAEAAVYTAPGTNTGQPTFSSQNATELIPDNGSLNATPEKKSLRLSGTGSAAVVNYTGPLSGVSAYVRGEIYNGSPNYTLKITNTDTNKLVNQPPVTGNVDGNYKFIAANQTLANAGNAKVGNYRIELSFDNDSYGGDASKDRNLVVDQIRVYGSTVSGPEASYLRVAPTVGDPNIAGSNPSGSFCSLNFYYLSGIDTDERSCDPAGLLGYDLGSQSLMQLGFNKIPAAIAQAYSQSGSCNPYQINASLTATTCDNGEIIKYSGNAVLGATSIPPGRHTIWVQGGSLTITGNVTNSSGAGLPPEKQPTLGIIAEGDVTIAPGVGQVDALVFAANKFNTCAGYPSAACQNKLVVNGQVITQNGFTFGRNFFSRYQANQSPAEQFVLNPMGISYAPPGFDKLFWGLDNQLNFSKSELQPRLQ